jgi:hypothetical protein
LEKHQMSNNNFVQPGSAVAVAASGVAASPVITAPATPLDRVQAQLAGAYSQPALHSHITYPTEGMGACGALLTIAAHEIHTTEGEYMLKLAFADTNAEGALVCKLQISYVNSLLGDVETLTPSGGEGLSKDRWRNIASGDVNVGDLLAAGFFAPDCAKEIVLWANSGVGEKKFMLAKDTDIKVVLRANARPKQDKVQAPGSRDIPAKVAPGVDANLGMELVYFQGATLLSKTSPLFGVVSGKAVRTAAELMALYAPEAMPVALPDLTLNNPLAGLAD